MDGSRPRTPRREIVAPAVAVAPSGFAKLPTERPAPAKSGARGSPRTTNSPSAAPASLQRFALDDLAPFTKEGAFSPNASRDFRLFYAGRDDVHGILRYLLSRATASLYLNLGRALARFRRFGE